MRKIFFKFHKYAKWSGLSLLLLLTACAPPPSSGGSVAGGESAVLPPVATNEVGVAGGIFTSPQGYRIEIPTGALSQTVALTVAPLDASSLPGTSPTGTSSVACVEFGPDGTVFNTPIIITVPLAAALTPGEIFDIYVYDDNDDIWEDSGFDGVVASDGLSVRAEISHFSVFAVFADSPDTTPPLTAGHQPASGFVSAAPDTSITVHVQDADSGVDESTIVMTVNGVTVNPAITGVPSDFTLTYTPTVGFSYSEVVNVTVNASDLSANSMPQDVYSFTITAQPDTSPPMLGNQNPAPDAVNIALTSNIYFELDDLGTGVDKNQLNLSIEGASAIVSGEFQPGFSGTIAADGAAGLDVTINPSDDFDYGQEVNLAVSAADNSNNAMSPVVYKFTCIDDTTAPFTADHDPAENAVDVSPDSGITFSVQDAQSGVDQASIVLTVNGNAVTPLVSGTPASYTLTYNPPADFNYDEVVSVVITATDLNGNQMTADAYSFTIGAAPDTTPPTVGSQDPAPDASGVARNSAICFAINDVDSGVASGSLNVTVNNVPAIASGNFQTGFSGAITQSGASAYEITINSAADFQYSQVVSVNINVSDNAGNAGQFSFSFTCEERPPETVSLPDQPNGTTSGLINTVGDFTVAGSASSYGDALEYLFDWGDGSTSAWRASGSTWSHSWDTTGTFPVKARARCQDHPAVLSDWSSALAVTISLPPDETAPHVSGRQPVAGAVGVSADTNIIVQLLDNGDGVDQASIILTVNGSPVTPLVSGAPANYTLTYDPPADFSYDEVVSVAITAADLNGNQMTADSWSFTIMPAPDVTSPTLSGLNPADGATKISVGANIYFEIDDSESGVDLNSIEVVIAGDNAIINGSMRSGFSGSIVSDGSGGYDITINPTVDFSYQQTVNVVIEAADLAAAPNIMATVNASFTCDYGGWTTSGDLTFARSGHTATKLRNGQVLVVGGLGDDGYRSSCELFDPADDSWSTTGDLIAARSTHSATLLADGRVLVAGGYSGGGGTLSSCEIYDPTTGDWSPVSGMNKARRGHSATLLPNGRVLVAGGWNNAGSFSSFEIYDPATDTWTAEPLADMPNARDGHTATLTNNGQVVTVAGWSTSSAVNSCDLFSLASGWSATAFLNQGRYMHTATLMVNGDVLVVGGIADSVLKSVELFNPTSGWSVKDNLKMARSDHTATLLADGNLLCVGGWNPAAGHLAESEFYDSVGGSGWSTLTETMARGRSNHTATLLDDKRVLITGGYDGSRNLAGCEIFTYNIVADNTAPEVTCFSPTNGDNPAPVDTDIKLTIIDPLNAGETFSGVDIDSVNITVAGDNAIIDGVFAAGFSGSIIENENGGLLIEINPDADFTGTRAVVVTIAASDLALSPNAMTPVSYSFVCE